MLRRRFHHGLAVVCLLGIANGPTLAQVASADAKLDDTSRIRAALADWRDASNSGDWHRAASHYAPGALIEFPGRADYTFEEIMRNVGRPPTVTWRHDFEIVEVIVDRSLAVLRVNFMSEQRQPDGSWKPGESIETIQVWRLQPDDRWRIVRTLSGKLP
jgi:ketosteroid isomerase-like protein